MCDIYGCGTTPSKKPLPIVTDSERRAFLKGLAALPLASVLAYPDLARAAAGATQAVSTDLPSGGKAVGALALPAKTPAPALLLVHEWWGLNDQIKSVAAEFAKLGYIALAIDMYNGKVATTHEEAQAYRAAMNPKDAEEAVAGALKWLKGHAQGTGKVGTVGWCFGGGWSLQSSILAPVDATVVYYGKVDLPADQLAHLKGPVLGHFGTLDKNINAAMVGRYEEAMKQAGKQFTTYWYEADHAFANPTGARYDEADAQLAWQRTTAFLAETLR